MTWTGRTGLVLKGGWQRGACGCWKHFLVRTNFLYNLLVRLPHQEFQLRIVSTLYKCTHYVIFMVFNKKLFCIVKSQHFLCSCFHLSTSSVLCVIFLLTDGTFSETFRGEDLWAGSLQGEVSMETEEDGKIALLTIDSVARCKCKFVCLFVLFALLWKPYRPRPHYRESKRRRSGQSVTASDFGSNGPRFESGCGRCVESLDKALYSHCPKEKSSH